MATILGGERWNERSVFDDDYQEELIALDDDYIREEYRTEDD